MVSKKNKKKKAQLPFRLNILFFIVFLLFSALVLQLGVVQILNGEAFQSEIDRTTNDYTEVPVPRGKMYDRNGELIVGNDAAYSITYTPEKGIQAEDRLNVAEKLAEHISMDSEDHLDSVTLRDKREYWYLNNTEEAKGLLSKKESEEMDNGEAYTETLKRIDEDKVDDYSKQQLEVMAIKKEMDKAMALTPQVIKNENVSPEEFARVSAHLDELPGINATTDWNRKYPYDQTFRDFAGSITSEEQGIPADQEDYYLTRGYSRNDRVGNSGLEEEYERVLRGRKEKIQYTTNNDGTVVDSDVVVDGQRGKDLVLTVDMELQQQVDKVLREEMQAAMNADPVENREMEYATAVVMDPNTGEILAASGQRYDDKENEFVSTETASIFNANAPGSSVKGATMLAGYESGVIEPGQRFYDTTINVASTPPKSSWTDLGWVNDYDALEQSSNVYMFYIAMRMGGYYNYEPNKPMPVESGTFQEMRNYYAQFGLGVETGIDFPQESTGFTGPNGSGKTLDLAIGQYDTYTTMQMAQYVSTIANGGSRVRPHFMKEVRNPIPHDEGLGPVHESYNTDIMNQLQMSSSEIDRVQEGFRRVFQEPNGTGSRHFADKPYDAAGKTGTAEYDKYHKDGSYTSTENLSLVGYAPYDDPEVAFAIMVPFTGKGSDYPINHNIGKGILDAYFELENDDEEE
ncbi:peptidoglycan D,D-transpeptidase FtsI family protein [Lentibacillus amyloliquefaciens]|uniref:serine-type D-Ala-D-Ala carboxypeptidase n=1 Tax=Lentibacillus amyloliquefaciens TaxID=1472767 RepID=A0A0U3W4I4_9BACI|nr:penicillin-binding protein 2 [Lentibacillus amyloliquefaciens]ALX48096.1 penicillin-binding protein [Lentibacillus amyloliquefaciens]